MWQLEIRHANPFIPDGFFVTEQALYVAQWTSLGNPGKEVSVSAFARVRAVFKDGVKIQDNPNLEEFYKNVSGPDAMNWRKGWKLGDELVPGPHGVTIYG